MKILIDASGVGRGGISSYLKAILQNWPKEDQLIVVGLRESLLPDIDIASSELITLRTVTSNRLAGIIKTLLDIIQIQKNTDVILLASPSLTSFMYRKKATVIIHDFMFLDMKQFVSVVSRIYRYLANWATLKNCRKIVFVSNVTASRFSKSYAYEGHDLKILSPTAQLSIIKEPIDQVSDLISKGKKIVVVPSHSPNKGSKWALNSLRFMDEDVVLTVLTGGKYDAELEPAFSEGVLFLDWISPTQYSWLLSNSSCMLFLSEYEGFGIPVIECKSIGLPIVISEDSGLAEASSGYAAVVQKQNPQEIADKVNEIIRSKRNRTILQIPTWKDVIEELSNFVRF